MRYALIALGLTNAIWAFSMAAALTNRGGPAQAWERTAMLTVGANVITLVWVGGVGMRNKAGRVGRLVGLWFDAKENELKKKAGSAGGVE